MSKDPYIRINLIFICILFALFVYSFAYPAIPNSLRLKSNCEKFNLENCPSKGLSRAFSKIIRVEFKEALNYNPYSIRIFSFFFLQFILRIAFILFHKKWKNLYYIDIFLTIVLFAICFFPIVFYLY